MLSLFVAGCKKIPAAPDEPVEPEIVALQVVPALANWLPKVASCANEIPNFGISTQILPRDELSIEHSDLILRLGEKMENDPFVSVVGTEEIVLVAGVEVPVNELSLQSVRAIFNGEYSDWFDVPETNGNSVEGKSKINILSFPPGDDVESSFRRIFLDDVQDIAAEIKYFSTVDFLQIQMEENPGSLTYLLRSQVPGQMKIVEVKDENFVAEILVLAVTKFEPVNPLKQFLLCLQTSTANFNN